MRRLDLVCLCVKKRGTMAISSLAAQDDSTVDFS